MQEPINIEDQLSGSKSSESREMDEPIRNEVAGPVSWLIPAPPKRVRSQLPQPPELRGSSSPKNRNNRSVNHPPHSTYNDVPQSGGGTPSQRLPALSPNRTRNSNFSPPGSPNSAKTSSVLRAWTKIFEVYARFILFSCSFFCSFELVESCCLPLHNRRLLMKCTRYVKLTSREAQHCPLQHRILETKRAENEIELPLQYEGLNPPYTQWSLLCLNSTL
jgi:hypothetical protein